MGDNIYTIAFYNLENLFDTEHNQYTLDEDYTPNGVKKWTPKRYRKKLHKLGTAISQIGSRTSPNPPSLIGVAEVENKRVIKDLLATESLVKLDYGLVHYESPDERGIDTALVYLKSDFTVINSEPIPLMVDNLNGVRDTTRDVLYVHGKFNGEEVHVFVNHWPSRRQGGVETAYKRIEASRTIKEYMLRLEEKVESPKYIVMGDFNDGPNSESISQLINGTQLYNATSKLLTYTSGSTRYKKSWLLFDQIIISQNFLQKERGTHEFLEAHIFDDHFLREWEGKYKGNPFRTYVGDNYFGGYSDHFPVFIELKYNG
ncbi:endonuclease [Flavobacteriaceae bacterium F89]|uniref:Endonuclease n=1 Tax=Cerina litoralis TaxID=2874477 RepID=A0AAE3EWF8_9FLAO|nr:endonuclease [Cerina litoralis]MCG2460911.1 endonuclease [Cerina litoralis]